jgi:hypothetical protein
MLSVIIKIIGNPGISRNLILGLMGDKSSGEREKALFPRAKEAVGR